MDLLLSCQVLVEDALGCFQGSFGGHRYMGYNSNSLPCWSGFGVRVDGGNAEEDVCLADTEGLSWVGSPGCFLSNDHSSADLLHDIYKLLSGAGSGSTGEDEETLS